MSDLAYSRGIIQAPPPIAGVLGRQFWVVVQSRTEYTAPETRHIQEPKRCSEPACDPPQDLRSGRSPLGVWTWPPRPARMSTRVSMGNTDRRPSRPEWGLERRACASVMCCSGIIPVTAVPRPPQEACTSLETQGPVSAVTCRRRRSQGIQVCLDVWRMHLWRKVDVEDVVCGC